MCVESEAQVAEAVEVEMTNIEAKVTPLLVPT